MIDYQAKLNPVARDMKPSGIRKFFEIAATRKDCISLGVGEPDFVTPEKFSRAGIQSILDGKTQYTANAGLMELRKAISKYLDGFIGVHYDPASEVIVTVGASEGLDAAFRAVCAPGDEVLVPEPCFVCYAPLVSLTGATPVAVKCHIEDEFKLNPAEVEAAITDKTKAIIVAFPNNPTGALMSEQMLKDICEIARSVGAWVLCDEVYRGLTQEDVYSPSVADLYEKGISTASMSKVFSMAGLRFGWIAAPREIIEAVLHHRDYNTISVGMLDEYFTELALTAKDKILERNRAIIRENLEILDKWVQSEPRASYVKPKAGTTAFVKIDTKLTSHEFCERLVKEKGVMFTPGSALHTEGYVRIGYANNKDVLQKGLALTSEFLKEID